MTVFYAIAFFCAQGNEPFGNCASVVGAFPTLEACERQEAGVFLNVSRQIAAAGKDMPVFQFECRAVEFRGEGA